MFSFDTRVPTLPTCQLAMYFKEALRDPVWSPNQTFICVLGKGRSNLCSNGFETYQQDILLWKQIILSLSTYIRSRVILSRHLRHVVWSYLSHGICFFSKRVLALFWTKEQDYVPHMFSLQRPATLFERFTRTEGGANFQKQNKLIRKQSPRAGDDSIA